MVKLSFAHAEGRNYRQLPVRARLREEPSPADIVYPKRYSLSELDVSGWTILFRHRSTGPRLLRVWYSRGQRDEMCDKPDFVGMIEVLFSRSRPRIHAVRGPATTPSVVVRCENKPKGRVGIGIMSIMSPYLHVG